MCNFGQLNIELLNISFKLDLFFQHPQLIDSLIEVFMASHLPIKTDKSKYAEQEDEEDTFEPLVIEVSIHSYLSLIH